MKNEIDERSILNIQSLKQLEYILNEDRKNIRILAENIDEYYQPFIKTINGKSRLIDRPFGKLKALQKKIKQRILSRPQLPAITIGSVKNKNLLDNARPHVNQKTVITVDIKKCFPKTKYIKVFKFFREKLGYSTIVASLLTKITTYKGYVPQGSSTSSALVNLILIDLAQEISDYCNTHDLHATLWVDDFTISGENPEQHISAIVKIIHKYGYSVQNKKIRIMHKKNPQTVTGINVNTKLAIPKKKRELYLATIKKSKDDPSLIKKISGQMEFIKFVNKKQYDQLIKFFNKYYPF